MPKMPRTAAPVVTEMQQQHLLILDSVHFLVASSERESSESSNHSALGPVFEVPDVGKDEICKPAITYLWVPCFKNVDSAVLSTKLQHEKLEVRKIVS
jgi:hypothetical protein